jgi:hypothetical protein
MSRDDIIRMADQAGLAFASEEFPHIWQIYMNPGREQIELFAALVAAAEREACARVCESMPLEWTDQPDIAQAELATIRDCALVIRSRGNNA